MDGESSEPYKIYCENYSQHHSEKILFIILAIMIVLYLSYIEAGTTDTSILYCSR